MQGRLTGTGFDAGGGCELEGLYSLKTARCVWTETYPSGLRAALQLQCSTPDKSGTIQSVSGMWGCPAATTRVVGQVTASLDLEFGALVAPLGSLHMSLPFKVHQTDQAHQTPTSSVPPPSYSGANAKPQDPAGPPVGHPNGPLPVQANALSSTPILILKQLRRCPTQTSPLCRQHGRLAVLQTQLRRQGCDGTVTPSTTSPIQQKAREAAGS